MHTFGGDWTEQKLGAFREYAQAYTTALRGRFDTLTYIDAFAGTGARISTSPGTPPAGVAGSAQLAISCKPGFDRFVFVDRKQKHVEELEALRERFPKRKNDICVRHGDANTVLQDVCAPRRWKASQRGLVFLDPYGMQVDWTTIEAIASVPCFDVWVLFPSGIGVNRLLRKHGDLPVHWQRRLDRVFGGFDWRTEFYSPNPQQSLFGDAGVIKDASVHSIERAYVQRLRAIFPAVLSHALRLRNSSNSVMYSLIFCCSNPSPAAFGLALKIAGAIVGKWDG